MGSRPHDVEITGWEQAMLPKRNEPDTIEPRKPHNVRCYPARTEDVGFGCNVNESARVHDHAFNPADRFAIQFPKLRLHGRHDQRFIRIAAQHAVIVNRAATIDRPFD